VQSLNRGIGKGGGKQGPYFLWTTPVRRSARKEGNDIVAIVDEEKQRGVVYEGEMWVSTFFERSDLPAAQCKIRKK